MQETSCGLAESNSGRVAVSSSTTWTCAGWGWRNSGGSGTEKLHNCSDIELDLEQTNHKNRTQSLTGRSRNRHKDIQICWAGKKETLMRVKPVDSRHPTNNSTSNRLHTRQWRRRGWGGGEVTHKREGQALKWRVTVLLSNCSSAQTHSDIPSCSYTAQGFESVSGCCLWNGIKDKHGHAAKQMHN